MQICAKLGEESVIYGVEWTKAFSYAGIMVIGIVFRKIWAHITPSIL